jgi:hypothetical protein
MTYPFSMHHPASRITPGYNLIWIKSQHSIVHVRSILCSGISPTTSGQCLACQSMSLRPLVTAIEDHARKPVTRLDHTTMSIIQHNEKLKEVHGHCVVAINAYNARRSHSLPHIHNSHGESPRRPCYTMPVQHPHLPPPPISLPVLEQFRSSILSYNNDVFS